MSDNNKEVIIDNSIDIDEKATKQKEIDLNELKSSSFQNNIINDNMTNAKNIKLPLIKEEIKKNENNNQFSIVNNTNEQNS
jgi:hypothetical protein